MAATDHMDTDIHMDMVMADMDLHMDMVMEDTDLDLDTAMVDSEAFSIEVSFTFSIKSSSRLSP